MSRAALLSASLSLLLAISGCTATAALDRPDVPFEDAFRDARERARRAERVSTKNAMGERLQCARLAHEAMQRGEDPVAAAGLANSCIDGWLREALREHREWRAGPARIGGNEIEVEFRALSPNFGDTIRLARAADVSVHMYDGHRFAEGGFGVAVAAVAPRCRDKPICALLPYSGVFRPATVWIESDDLAEARVVIADPLRIGPAEFGAHTIPLALDTSAAYAFGMAQSPVGRLAVWGLIGGDDIGKRAGVYLMEDYDPGKRPLIMVHGLGSSPLAWAKLSNAIWGDPSLRERFQIWHVVYQTDAPLFVARRRLVDYLDTAFDILDPEHDDAARSGIVLIGHSLGGVLSRLLAADAGQTLWTAAFNVTPEALPGDPDDVAMVRELLLFHPYPGLSRAIFLAAPHHGSPLADAWYARLINALAGRRTPEMKALGRIARAHPEAVREELRAAYQGAAINSIWTLRASQPVRRASEKLLPASYIPYNTVAGRLPGRLPEGDGVVPLSSAMVEGAESTAIVASGHDVYANDQAIDEILRILRLDVASQETVPRNR